MIRRILFVCTGNTCRSPMAEGLFQRMAEEAGLDVEVRSAGVSAMDGNRISAHTSKILKESGIAGEDMRSNALTRQTADWADLILTMTIGHKAYVLQMHPHTVDKVHALKEFVEDDPAVLQTVLDREAFVAEIQLKRALGQQLTAEDQLRASALDRVKPDFDIGDPYGGPLEAYREVAGELDRALRKLIERLKREN